MTNSSAPAFHRMPVAALALALPLLVFGCEREESTGGTPPSAKTVQAASSALTVLDLAGRTFDPFADADSKAIVFVFISTDCPISNRYAPEIRRVEEAFARSGVRMWLVYADADTSAEAIRKHIKD